MEKSFRDNGAIGALLDEYEKAIHELIELIKPISLSEYETIVDTVTKDDDTRSIQTIMRHVVRAGYYYCVATRNHLGESAQMPTIPIYSNIADTIHALTDMFEYNLQMFEHVKNNQIESFADSEKIKVRWGQSYDIEQLYEHAIVHILRHRRQIERFLIKLNN